MAENVSQIIATPEKPCFDIAFRPADDCGNFRDGKIFAVQKR
jgi:hypothetical protein